MSRHIGTITVLDLHVFCQEYGRGSLPYPFRFTKPTPYEYEDELNSYRANLIDRFTAGEFDHLRRWLDVQMRAAEIRVEPMFMNANEVTAAFSATRWQELGFIANQDPNDIISVSQLSAYDLGSEIARLAELSGKPGTHPRVTVPSMRIFARGQQPASTESVVLEEVRAVGSKDLMALDVNTDLGRDDPLSVVTAIGVGNPAQ